MGRPASGDPMTAQVQLEVAGPEPLGGSGRCLRAPEHRPDAGDQLARAERLHDVVVGPELEAGHPVGLVPARGEHDDRDSSNRAAGPG